MVFTSNINLITTSTTLSTKDDVYLVNATGGSITIILPNITCDGMQYKLKRIDVNTANTVTVQGFAGAQTIDGNTSIILIPFGICEVQSYSSVWYIVSDSSAGSGGVPIFTSAFVQNNGRPYITFAGTNNQLICSFYYGGSNSKPINAIVYTVSKGGASNPTGSIGIYTQAGATIAQITIPTIGTSGDIASSISTTTITNLPTSAGIIEARVNLTTAGTQFAINVSSLTIY